MERAVLFGTKVWVVEGGLVFAPDVAKRRKGMMTRMVNTSFGARRFSAAFYEIFQQHYLLTLQVVPGGGATYKTLPTPYF